MEALLYTSLAANALAGFAVLLLWCSSINRRRFAAWLLTSARAKDEIEAAIRGIRQEQRMEQTRIERRFLGLAEPSALIEIAREPRERIGE